MTLVIAAPLRAQPAQPLALLDVPFLSQSEALCGGAAAAMVLRYWGERGISADDFAPLVDRSAGGIRTRALVDALRGRGWNAAELSGATALQGALSRGHPVIALIEDRPGVHHYIVIVGWHDQAVVAHDPARSPFRVMPAAEFERRWQATARWAVVVQPLKPLATSEVPADPRGSPGTSEVDGMESAGAGNSCDGLVRDGVQFAQKSDLPAAERALAEAAYRCGGAAPLRELAGVRLLQRRWPEVAELASEALRLNPLDQHSARLLGTSRFVQGDTAGALRAWNAAQEPVIDLMTIDGLDRTRFRVVERYLGVTSGAILTPRLLQRSRRRLEEFPSATITGIDYAPLEEGRAEVRAHLAERRPLPRGVLDYGALAARAAAQRELSWPLASLSGGGELLSASWRFWPDRPRYAVALAAPFPVGIVTATAYGERQPFSDSAVAASERAGGSIAVGQWSSDRVRWSAHAGADRWNDRKTLGAIGGSLDTRFALARIEAGGTLWAGTSTFGIAHAAAQWRTSAAQRGTVFTARASLEQASRTAPMDLWPAGDTGHVRQALLRAHPALDGAGLRVDRLGRTMMGASLGLQRWFAPAGPIRSGLEGFLDAGRTFRRLTGPAVADADIGVGLRLALAGTPGVFHLNAARGLRDGRHAFSILWNPEP